MEINIVSIVTERWILSAIPAYAVPVYQYQFRLNGHDMAPVRDTREQARHDAFNFIADSAVMGRRG